ncbi:MAG: helix-turn-helix transcriptional regulator [Clostridia bacterium]|nr:helix-turn-helix transcriptional regulator [Clostridia bacterium]
MRANPAFQPCAVSATPTKRNTRPIYSLFGYILQFRNKKYYEQFGLNVVYYRKKKRLTQMKLAEMADIDRSHISAIELGNVGVSFDVIFKLCEVLEITPKQLFDFRE